MLKDWLSEGGGYSGEVALEMLRELSRVVGRDVWLFWKGNIGLLEERLGDKDEGVRRAALSILEELVKHILWQEVHQSLKQAIVNGESFIIYNLLYIKYLRDVRSDFERYLPECLRKCVEKNSEHKKFLRIPNENLLQILRNQEHLKGIIAPPEPEIPEVEIINEPLSSYNNSYILTDLSLYGISVGKDAYSIIELKLFKVEEAAENRTKIYIYSDSLEYDEIKEEDFRRKIVEVWRIYRGRHVGSNKGRPISMAILLSRLELNDSEEKKVKVRVTGRSLELAISLAIALMALKI